PNCPRCGQAMVKWSKAPASGKPRWACVTGHPNTKSGRKICYITTNPNVPPRGQNSKTRGQAPVFRRTKAGTTIFVITSAQNATPKHKGFYAALEQYCNHRSAAARFVIPTRYKNPTSRWTDSQEGAEWWDIPRTDLLSTRLQLNQNITILGDIKTQPTASSPLVGYDAITGLSSGVLGHTKLAQRCIPTPQNKLPKILTTTGACTVANYTDSRAGKLGEFHHSLSALVVEIHGKTFHLRQLCANKDGSFIDLDTLYTPDSVTAAGRPLALVMGDTHVDFIDKAVKRATFDKGGIIDTLKPLALVWHDLLDAYSVNPHHRGNPFNALAKRLGGLDDARAEVQRAVEFIDRHTPKGVESIVVASNHDDMLRRWIIANDWKLDPINAAFYLETALAMVKGTRLTDSGTTYPSPFPYWVEKLSKVKPRVLNGSESYTLGGIELAMHGDQGPNGARGSIRN